MSKISVVIPCFNEEENVEAIASAVRAEFEEYLPEYDYEIIFIDNDSRDRTRDLIRLMAEKDPHVKAIFNAKNFGQFKSPYYGLLQMTGDAGILLDWMVPGATDLDQNTRLTDRFGKPFAEGARPDIGCYECQIFTPHATTIMLR